MFSPVFENDCMADQEVKIDYFDNFLIKIFWTKREVTKISYTASAKEFKALSSDVENYFYLESCVLKICLFLGTWLCTQDGFNLVKRLTLICFCFCCFLNRTTRELCCDGKQ